MVCLQHQVVFWVSLISQAEDYEINVFIQETTIVDNENCWIHCLALVRCGAYTPLPFRLRMRFVRVQSASVSRYAESIVKLRAKLVEKVKDGQKELNVYRLLSHGTLETIGLAALGYRFNSLSDDARETYADHLKALLCVDYHVFTLSLRTYVVWCRSRAITPLAPFRAFLPTLFSLGSPEFRRWIVEHLPFSFVQKPCKIIDIMDRETQMILKTRKRALEQGDEEVKKQVSDGKDVLGTLCGCICSGWKLRALIFC